MNCMNMQAPAGQTHVWSTSTVGPKQAFQYWQDLICDTFVQLSAAPTTTRQFQGRITTAAYQAFEMSTVRAGGQRVRRTPRLIARAHEEYILASIQTRGRGRVEQGGRVAVLEPGSMAFYDSTAPYVLHFDDAFEQIVIQLPRQDLLASSGVGGRAVHATAVPLGADGAAGVIASFFRSLSVAQRHDPSGAASMSSHAPSLVASALSLACGQAPTAGAAESLVRERVLSFLRVSCGDPTLDAEAIAKGCHLSRRTLFRLFEGDPQSVGRSLRQIRVERAQRMLLEQPGRPVRAVGVACGFGTEGQFHRAFREVSGCTPAAYRAAGGGDGRV